MADDAKLIAVVEANTKGIENALKRLEGITTASTRRISASVAKADASFLGLGKTVSGISGALGKLGIGAALGLSIQGLVSSFTSAAKKAGDLADAANKIGISTKSLQELRFAATQSGVEIGEMDAALTKFSKNLSDARNGAGDLSKLFAANGIDAARSKLLTYDQALDVVADLMKNAANAQDRLNIAQVAFGRGGLNLVNLFGDGAHAVAGFRAEAEKLGVVLGDDIVKAGARMDDELQALEARFGTFADTALLKTLQVLEAIGRIEHGVVDTIGDAISKGQASAARDEIATLMKERDALQAQLSVGGGSGLSGFIFGDSDLAKSERIDQINAELKQREDALEAEFEYTRAIARGFGSDVDDAARQVTKLGSAAGAVADSLTAALKNQGTFAASLAKVPDDMKQAFFDVAKQFNLDPNLLASVAKAESGFNPKATSPAGAQGLMQLMPATAAGLGVTDPMDWKQSLVGGAKYLRQLLDMFNGDVAAAVAAYNAGPARVQKAFKGATTRAYEAWEVIGKTSEGRMVVVNPNGGLSTEISQTLDDPRQAGKYINLPSLFQGKPVSPEEALDRIIKAGFKDPETGNVIQSFGSIAAAEAAAVARSKSLESDPGFLAAQQTYDMGRTTGGSLDVSKLPKETREYVPKVLKADPDTLDQIVSSNEADAKAAADATEKTKELIDAKQALIASAQQQVEALGLEAKSFGQSTFEAEKAKVEFDLLNQAKAAGIPITAELKAQIDQLSTAMASGTVAVADAQTKQDEFNKATENTTAKMDEFRSFSSGVLSGFISDLVHGKSAAEALGDALSKIGDKLIDMASNSIIESIFGKQGTSAGGFFGSLFGGGASAGLSAGALSYASTAVGLVHQGGVIGSSSLPTRTVPNAIFAGAPRYHSGGIAGLKPGELPAILRAGEMVLPSVPKIGAMPGRGGGDRSRMDVHNRISVEPSPLFVVSVKDQVDQGKRETLAAMPGYLADKKRRSPGGRAGA